MDSIEVTSDNVVELAVLFRTAADRLEREAKNIDHDLRLPEPWLGDPVSRWIWEVFNKYFVEDENSFASVVRDTYDQHMAQAKALVAAAARYRKTDELNAELLKRQK